MFKIGSQSVEYLGYYVYFIIHLKEVIDEHQKSFEHCVIVIYVYAYRSAGIRR